MLTQKTLNSKVAALKELKSQKEELEKKISKIEDSLKAEMKERGEYELVGTTWKITWNMVSSTRFDQKSFKEAHPKLFEAFKHVSESRRFLLN